MWCGAFVLKIDPWYDRKRLPSKRRRNQSKRIDWLTGYSRMSLQRSTPSVFINDDFEDSILFCR